MIGPRRRRLARCAVLAVLAAGAGCGATRGSVLLITIDTLRPDHLSCYGYRRPTSPTIDEVAAAGLLFEDAHAHAPVTAPAHASILTGRLPAWHQVLDNADVLPDGIDTLAERMRAAGYRTAAFISNATITAVVHFDQGFEVYDDDLRQREANRPQTERTADRTVAAALAWLEAHHREPFFCWVHLQDPHGPYVPPPGHAEAFLAEARAGAAERLPLLEDQTGLGGIPRYQALGRETDANVYVADYDGEIHFMDAELGRLLGRLRDWNVDPLLVLTADHGEALGEHGYYFAHGHALTEDLVRVPLVLRGPDVPRGVRSTEPAQHLDVVPTVLAWAGLPVPADLPGRDLLAPPAGPRPSVAQKFPDTWAVTLDGTKLIDGPEGAVLYALGASPADEREAGKVAAGTRARLEAALAAERERPAPPWPRTEADRAMLYEQLQRLGYVE